MVQPAACVYVPLPSCVQPFYNFTECSPPGSSVHGISQQEYWSGFPFPPPGDLLNSVIKHASPVSPALAGEFFATEPPGKPTVILQPEKMKSVTASIFPSLFAIKWWGWLLIAKFRLKLKKVGKTTRPFRYDLNQTPMIIQWK